MQLPLREHLELVLETKNTTEKKPTTSPKSAIALGVGLLIGGTGGVLASPSQPEIQIVREPAKPVDDLTLSACLMGQRLERVTEEIARKNCEGNNDAANGPLRREIDRAIDVSRTNPARAGEHVGLAVRFAKGLAEQQHEERVTEAQERAKGEARAMAECLEERKRAGAGEREAFNECQQRVQPKGFPYPGDVP